MAARAGPTLGWIALLRLHGTTHYNHEAVRYHQLVWLPKALRQLPPAEPAALISAKLHEYVGSLYLVGNWLLLGAGLLVATWWRVQVARRGPGAGWRLLLPARALAWTLGCFGAFSRCWATTPSG